MSKNTPSKWTKSKTKNYYIANEISLRNLAVEANIPYPTLREWCKKEKWVDLRKKKNIKAISKVIEKASDKEAQEILDYLETNKDLHREIKKLIKNSKDAKDLRSLAAALKDSHIIHRLEQGQSTENIVEENTNTNLNVSVEDKETYDKWTSLLNRHGK